ncbi:MAG: hypothetical protein ABIL00_07675 [candidate division WOR-3 bacterium]
MRFLIIFFFLFNLCCAKFLPTPIEKILNDPRGYEGREVLIRGEVTEVFSLIFIKYFKVKDKTGEIVVLTEKPFPKEGNVVKVKGKVETIQIGNETYTVIRENKE